MIDEKIIKDQNGNPIEIEIIKKWVYYLRDPYSPTGCTKIERDISEHPRFKEIQKEYEKK